MSLKSRFHLRTVARTGFCITGPSCTAPALLNRSGARFFYLGHGSMLLDPEATLRIPEMLGWPRQSANRRLGLACVMMSELECGNSRLLESFGFLGSWHVAATLPRTVS